MKNINLAALRAIRKSHNLTLKELAAQMQVSPSAIGMYERGQRTPDIIYLSRLAALLETPITSFVDEGVASGKCGFTTLRSLPRLITRF
ncbi:helix-turn-helix domain-containing protein [Paenibacillus bovis]|uniref:helix-turn-helix domain-containing protein n=1 Tax=Paenibacillus bovis TaxID=1616788 RepID=UPI000B350988|nr:helix-turn-helix transcriptional regulator [Paenibacillus bovis]